jgi:hypothetical protein
VLIGERPGLSAPYSLGAYLTWRPIPERTTDADPNSPTFCTNAQTGGFGRRPEGRFRVDALDEVVNEIRPNASSLRRRGWCRGTSAARKGMAALAFRSFLERPA